MNEHIEELMMQASECDSEVTLQELTAEDINLEKFADLIIKQCVSIVNTWSEEEPCSEGYDIMSVYRIKEYFGVTDE